MLDIKTTFNNVEESGISKDVPLSFPISNSDVTRAGDVIRSCMESSNLDTKREEEFTNALLILRKYRENHAPCLKIFSNLLKEKLERLEVDQESIVGSRTKRLESISMKLVRFPSTRLSQMEDIVGIRVTLPNMQAVERFINDREICEIYNSDYIENDARTNNYISKPKPDGYRGIHQIFKCKVDNKIFRLELQIRTKVQHEWATIVEILGSLYKASFKAGEGDKRYLRFLELTSVLFSIEENAPVISSYAELTSTEICTKLNALEKELKVIEKLKSVNSINLLGKSPEAKYYLIQLDLESRETRVLHYFDGKKANENYYRLEKTYKGSDKFDVVLVSVDDVNKIEEAYPNYFLDSDSFINRYNKLLSKYS